MPLWRDLKTITTSSLGAMSSGAESLAHMTAEVRRSAEKFALASTVSTSERHLEFRARNDVSASELDEAWRTLTTAYDELWPVALEAERNDLTNRRQKIEGVYLRALVEQVNSRISAQVSLLCEDEVSLPIERIQRRNALKNSQEQLANYYRRLGEQALLEEVIRKIETIDKQVSELELRREETKTAYYPDGNIKRRLKHKDGELNGTSEGFHANGSRQFEAVYRDGVFAGKATYWREDGSVAFEISKQIMGGTRHRIYLPDGQLIGQTEISSEGAGTSAIWIWDGCYVGSMRITEWQPKKLGFYLEVLMNPRLWFGVIKHARSPKGVAQVEAMSDAFSLSKEKRRYITNLE